MFPIYIKAIRLSQAHSRIESAQNPISLNQAYAYAYLACILLFFSYAGMYREKEARRSAGFSISSVLIVSTQRRHMCEKRLAIHANSFRKFNRRIRRLCRMVVGSFVRSWCEQRRDKDRGVWRVAKGEVKGDRKQKVESKRRREKGGWPRGKSGESEPGRERIAETRKESESRVECVAMEPSMH